MKSASLTSRNTSEGGRLRGRWAGVAVGNNNIRSSLGADGILQQILLRAAFYADGRVIKASHVRRAIALGMRAQSIAQQTNLKAARCRHVQDIVAACAGDTKRASELLGISRRQVYRFLRARSVLGERPVGDAV